jgi:hypothetical protein
MPSDPPLVEPLAELRMIRSLQLRVNRRTQTYARLIQGSEAGTRELREALGRLAERQRAIFDATRDIATGKNR